MKLTSIGHDRMYPPIGCAYRSYHLSKYLSNNFEVTLIGHSGAITSTKQYTIKDNFRIIEIPGLVTTALGAVGYFFTKKPLFDPLVAYFCNRSPKLLKCYLSLADTSEILVFEGCWHFPLLTNVKDSAEKLIIYDAHNVEYISKERVYTRYIRKKLLSRIFDLEKNTCRESDIILATSKYEKELFSQLYGIESARIRVMPNGVAIPELRNRTEKIRTILFVGGAYFANFDAAQFINNVLAHKLPDFKFKIAGRCCMAVKKPAKNVELYGFVSEEEKDKLLRTSALAINPILHGAGMNVKMLEYMAYGIPVVTTGFGARGIEYDDDKKPFVISELEDFAVSIKELNANKELAENVSRNAVETIRQKYEWSKVTEGIAELLIEKVREKLL